jgi:CHASE3 domain sensor protein
MITAKSYWILRLSLLILPITVIINHFATTDLLEANKMIYETYEVISNIEKVRSSLLDAESSQKGYLITQNDGYMYLYRSAIARIFPTLENLEKITKNNPHQQQCVYEIQILASKRIERLENAINVRQDKGMEEATKLVLTNVGKGYMDQIRVKIFQIEEEELKDFSQKCDKSKEMGYKALWICPLMIIIDVIIINVFAAFNIRERYNDLKNYSVGTST